MKLRFSSPVPSASCQAGPYVFETRNKEISPRRPHDLFLGMKSENELYAMMT
jgi:hypothetical protein